MGTHGVEKCLEIGKYINPRLGAGEVLLEMDQVTFEATEKF